MSALELLAHPAEEIGAKLAGRPVERLVQLGGGRNSRVWRLCAGGTAYALKQYPHTDTRDRLGAEAAALRLMEAHGLDMVPRVVATDRDAGFALLTWAEGARIGLVREADVDQALAFLTRLRPLGEFPTDRLASEACLSGGEIERQIIARLARLHAVGDAPEMQKLLDRKFAPVLDWVLAEARPMFGPDLPQPRRVLAPADFGFHNALRDEDGQLTFIDFEYFGWDDPVKLVADVLLHPGTPVADPLRQRFRAGAEQLYGDDPDFSARLRAFYPLFGLRWVLILLNEFLPEARRRRQLAGAEFDRDVQLGKAAAMLERISGSNI